MTTPLSSTPRPDSVIASDPDARELLARMLGPALRRQLWAFFLDSAGRSLPIIIPIEGIPVSPNPHELRAIVAGLGAVMEQHGPGGSILLALERPGDAKPHGFDELWADGLHSAALHERVPIFGIYLVHSDGLRMMKARSVLPR